MKTAKPPPSRAALFASAVLLLKQIQAKFLHEPNSDFHEYCRDCGNSPHRVPAHNPGCLVPRIERLLKKIREATP